MNELASIVIALAVGLAIISPLAIVDFMSMTDADWRDYASAGKCDMETDT